MIYSILSVLVGLILQLLFIRYSSYTINRVDYGTFVILQTLIIGLQQFLLQLPSQAFDRFYNDSKDKFKIINDFKLYIVILCLLSLLIIGLFGFFNQEFSTKTLLLCFTNFVFIARFTFDIKVLLLNLERKKYFYCKVIDSISKFVLPIALYSYHGTVDSLLFGMTIGYALCNLYTSFYIKFDLFKSVCDFSLSDLKKYTNYAYPILFVGMFTWLISFSDRYFIAYFLTEKDVGDYALLATLSSFGQILGTVYFMYAEPIILKESTTSMGEAHSIINRNIRYLVVLFAALFMIFLMLPREIFTIIISPELLVGQNYIVLSILILSIFLNVLHVAFHMHLKLMNKLSVVAVATGIGSIVNVGMNFFISDYGIIVAALSTLFAYVAIFTIQFVCYNYICRKGVIG